MAWENAYTADYRDLLFRLKEIITGLPLVTRPIRSGVGDGILYGVHTLPTTPIETWTVTCIDNMVPATFSVVGSVTGATANAHVGTHYDNGAISFDILAGSVAFAAGFSFVFDVQTNPLVAAAQTWTVNRWIGTGSKVLNYLASSMYSTSYIPDYAVDGTDTTAWRSGTGAGVGAWWQVEYDKPIDMRLLTLGGYHAPPNGDYLEAPNSFIFSYSDDGTHFTTDTVVTGQINWQQGEQRNFSLAGTSGAHRFWRLTVTALNGSATTAQIPKLQLFDVNNRFNVAFYGDGPELMATGPGTAGGDSIYISIRTDSHSFNGPNWMIGGAVGYSDGLDAFGQPNNSAQDFYDAPRITMYDQPMVYWITVSGRGVIVATRFQNICTAGCLKFINTYSLPVQFPYPLYIAGCQDAGGNNYPTYGYTRTDLNHSVFVNPGSYAVPLVYKENLSSPARLFTPYNTWKQVCNRAEGGFAGGWSTSSNLDLLVSSPYQSEDNTTYAGAQTQQVDGQWPMNAIVLIDRRDQSSYGELDGVKHISGQHEIESLITHEGDTWVILNNIHRVGDNDFWALRLS